MPFASIVKPVPQLHIYLTWIGVVCAAESFAVIQQETPVGGIQGRHGNRVLLGERFAERNIEACVSLQMGIREIAASIRETGTVIQVAARDDSVGQVEVISDMEGVPLVVVQHEIAAIGRRKIGETSGDRACSLGVRVGIGEIDFSAVEQSRRANTYLPAIETRMVNGQRKEHIGIADGIVIEIILRALMIVVQFK